MYQRAKVAIAIVQALRSVGGMASRTKLHQLIADSEDSGFTYDDVFSPVISKNGNEYVPFDYDFNFALNDLSSAEFVEHFSRGESIVLTEKGRSADLSKFPRQEDLKKINAFWHHRSARRAPQTNEEPEDEESASEAVAKQVSKAEEWRVQLLKQLKQFSPAKFEKFARLLISQMGVRIDKGKGLILSGDHGIDGYGYFESNEFRTSRIAIQAKCYTDSAVSEPEIDKFKGVMDGFNAEYGIFITTTYFTKNAKDKAVQGTRTVTLIDGQRIADLVAQYQLYVTPVQSFQLDDYYFEQE